MWFLPTRGRPEKCQAVLDACVAMNMTLPGLVVVDGDSYPELKLPNNWFMEALPDQLELGGVLNWCFETYPEMPFYGFLSDDTVPRTQGWDVELETSAIWRGIASSNDLWKGNTRMAGALCFKGSLLRRWGYWCLPGLIHLYIDDVWEEEGWTYREDVIVEHLHFANGKAEKDETYARTFKGQSYAANDKKVFEEWKNALC